MLRVGKRRMPGQRSQVSIVGKGWNEIWGVGWKKPEGWLASFLPLRWVQGSGVTTGQLWYEVLSCERRWKRGKVRDKEDSEKWFPPFLSLCSWVFKIHFPFFGQAKLSQMLSFSLPLPCSFFLSFSFPFFFSFLFFLLSLLFSLLAHSDQSPTMCQALNEAQGHRDWRAPDQQVDLWVDLGVGTLISFLSSLALRGVRTQTTEEWTLPRKSFC